LLLLVVVAFCDRVLVPLISSKSQFAFDIRNSNTDFFVKKMLDVVGSRYKEILTRPYIPAPSSIRAVQDHIIVAVHLILLGD
jgi:hypothetical protein